MIVVRLGSNELTKYIHTRKSGTTGIHNACYQIAHTPLTIEQ